MPRADVTQIPFATLYPLLVAKAVKKGRTREEVDRVTGWLTGYTPGDLSLIHIFMYAFYGMIMFFNDGSFTAGELAGLGSCLGLAAAVAAALWCVYRLAVRGVFRVLGL